MMYVKATVRGDREIIMNMRRAYNSVGGKALAANLTGALQPMKEETEEKARALRNYPGKHPGWPDPSSPRPGGHLDQGVRIAKKEARGLLYLEVWLSFTKRARKLAHLVEFGTAPHFQPGLGIFHPGARPFPFARPAFEETKDETVDMVGRTAWRQISTSLIAGLRR